MKTLDELADWVEGAGERFGDPSQAVGQIFARWSDNPQLLSGDLIECGNVDGVLRLKLGPGAVIPIEIAGFEPEVGPISGKLEKFGATEICAGVWALTPSLHIPGLIHVFVVLYDVPATTRWDQKRILIVSA